MRIIIKKTLLGFISLLFASGLYAQKDESRRYDFKQGSEISVSYGYDYLNFGGGDMCYFPGNQWSSFVNTPFNELFSFNNYFENKGMRKGPTSVTGAINLTYTYRLKSWFELSGRLTYSGEYSDYYDGFADDLLLYNYDIHAASVVVTARFLWLNRKYVRLYSSIGLGVRSIFETGENGNDVYFLPALDLTYFGIKAGKNVYGFAELSLGVSGLVSAGIGFNLSNWRD